MTDRQLKLKEEIEDILRGEFKINNITVTEDQRDGFLALASDRIVRLVQEMDEDAAD